MVGLALVFSVVFGAVFGGQSAESKISVGVADLDSSALSASMVQSLQDSGVYSVKMLSKEDLYSAVRQGKASAGVVIPAGFEASLSSGEPLEADIVSLSASGLPTVLAKVLERKVTEYLLAGAVRGAARSLAMLSSVYVPVQPETLVEQVLDEFRIRPALTVEVVDLSAGEVSRQSDSSAKPTLGIYVMFTMFTVIFSCGDILKERREGTWLRLMAAPVSRASIVGGKILGAYLVGALQLAVLLFSGWCLRNLDFGPNPPLFLLVIAVFLFVVTGLGIMLSTMVKTLPQLGALAPIVIVATCMLGGCYWPLELVPPYMQVIAKFTPQAWAMSAMADVVYHGARFVAVLPNILVLIAFGALFFVLGVSRIKFE